MTNQIHALASERWNIHHIALGGAIKMGWQGLGEQCHLIRGENDVVPAIVGIVRDHLSTLQAPAAPGEVSIDVTTHDSPNPPQTIPTPL